LLESNKEIFRKREYELFEQQCIQKKLMRTILATYPPVLDEQDSTKFSNYLLHYAAVYCPTYYINTKQSCVKLSLDCRQHKRMLLFVSLCMI